MHLLQMTLHFGYITNYLYHIHFEQVLIFEHKFRCFCNHPEKNNVQEKRGMTSSHALKH
jgi:hypothetical protein